MKVMKCARCGKELTEDMEIEYSEEIDKYFCDLSCAMDVYFEYMGSTPIEKDSKELADRKIIIKNGKLYYCSD